MSNHSSSSKNRVLIVDDDPIICNILSALLADDYEVESVSSGEECLEVVARNAPELIVLDIEMPGINGYDTCRQLVAAGHKMPVIFLSGHDTLEERLEAFDSGGEDFLGKPAQPELLLRKVRNAIKAKQLRDQLAGEKDSFEQMAMTFLDSMGETGVIQNYTRDNFSCPDYATLLSNTLKSTRNLGLDCHIQLRFPGGSLSASQQGPLSPLEESVLLQGSTMGRLFQFKKRLITNFEHVSILILNMPDNPDLAGRIRDNIAIVAEIADALVNSVTLRMTASLNAARIQDANQNASSATAILREKYRTQQMDTRLLLDDLITEVEKTYVFLGLSAAHERMVTEVLNKNADKILRLFEQGVEFEKQFTVILESLRQE